MRFQSLIPALALVALVACDSSATDPEPDPEPEPDPLTAVITGPLDAYIDDEGRAPVEFRASESEGDFNNRVWTLLDQSGAELESADGDRFTPDVSEPGLYTVRLKVTGEDVEPHDTSQVLEIYPAIGLNFPAAIAIVRREETGEPGYPDFPLHTFDPKTRSISRLSDAHYNESRFSWSPDGRYLGVSVHTNEQSDDVGVFDTQTGEHYIFTDNPGVSMMLAWNPVKDIIAFTDDHRIPNFASDELYFVILDMSDLPASDVVPLAGESLDSTFYGHFPSWSPDGERLALGNSRFYIDGQHIRRIAIHSGLPDNPQRQRLVPEDSLLTFVERATGRSYPSDQIQSGSQAVGWSPDGRWIAFNVMTGYVESGFNNLLVKAEAGGSGRMRLIQDFAGKFTWSPDGNWLYFNNGTITRDDVPRGVLFRVHSGGGGLYEEVLSNAYHPAWYSH